MTFDGLGEVRAGGRQFGQIGRRRPVLIKDQDRLDHPALRPVAQGVESIPGQRLAALLREQTGSWLPVFAIIIAMDALTGLLALSC
jgi:hypothetical protein